MQAIKDVDFQNNWTQNHISFTSNGNPRNVKYSVVSFQQKQQCFVEIGQWDCLANAVNETCKGNLTLRDTLTSGITNNFLGVCGALCPAGQYKIVDTHFASCCWQCKNCTGNRYSRKPGSSACERCENDEWPTDDYTACAKVKPQMVFFTENPAGIILLCVNIVIIKILIAFAILIIKYSQSKMKIFSDRILCYILLFGILMCNVVSIFVLTDAHKDNCLLMVILSKLGSTCTLGTIFIKINDVYRTYKKKILRSRCNSNFKMTCPLSLTRFNTFIYRINALHVKSLMHASLVYSKYLGLAQYILIRNQVKSSPTSCRAH